MDSASEALLEQRRTPDLVVLEANLSESLRRHPFDFMSSADFRGGAKLSARELCRRLSPDDDLRFVFDDWQHGEILVHAERLPWDSEFFGFEIAGVEGIYILDSPGYHVKEDLRNAARHLVEVLNERRIRYAIAKIDSRDIAVCRALCAAGFDLIEVRAWYHRSLVDFEPKERFNVRQAKVEDIPRLAQTAVNRKNPYDRFHADPILADELVNRLMETWVENSIAGDFADLVMVPNSENPAAFCTARKRQDLWEPLNLKVSQTVLSAVDKSFRGWYPKIFSEVCCRLKEMGAEHIFAKTQTTNTSVIKTWERISLKYAKTELVFRYSDVAQ